jgi:hypothetical protein
MANENMNEIDRLVELKGSGYEIAKGEPDIRGWDVKDVQGRTFGTVDELLFDKESRKVRYIILDLKGNLLHLELRKVLIPIGLAELHEERDDVVLTEVTAAHLSELPSYKKGTLTIGAERSVRNTFAALGAGALGAVSGHDTSDNDQTNFYEHHHFNQENLYNKRQRPSTDANSDFVRKTDESDPGDFREGTIEFTEHKEVPIITKEARVVEEVSLNKEIEERDATIKDTVRKTDVDIERTKADDKHKRGHQGGLIGEHDLS